VSFVRASALKVQQPGVSGRILIVFAERTSEKMENDDRWRPLVESTLICSGETQEQLLSYFTG